MFNKKKQIAMKREEKSQVMTRISLILLIPAALTFIFAASSQGKTGNSGIYGGQNSASLQAFPSVSSDSIYEEVDSLPLFHDGDNALLKFIAENTKYPELAKKNNITGKVIVRFVVEKDCSISNVSIVKEVNPLLDAEAVKVISSLPNFEKPARKGGKAVRVYYMVPITFSLK